MSTKMQNYKAYYNSEAYALKSWSHDVINRIKKLRIIKAADQLEYKFRVYNNIDDDHNWRRGNVITVPQNPDLDWFMKNHK